MKYMNTNLIQKALSIALSAHANQARKADGSPYIIHPIMVAMKLAQHGFSETVIAAALCHDVLEDTDVPEVTLRKELGDEVVDIIIAVSNDDSLPWEEKKLAYIESVRNGPDGAKAVCIADKMHNMESLLVAYDQQGSELWSKFNRGKNKKVWFEKKVLAMLKQSWDHPLLKEYETLIEREEALD